MELVPNYASATEVFSPTGICSDHFNLGIHTLGFNAGGLFVTPG